MYNDIAFKNDKFVIKDNQSVTSLNSRDPASCLMLANNLFLIKIEMKHIFCMRNKFIVLSAECIKRRWTTATASRVCLIFCHFNCQGLLWTSSGSTSRVLPLLSQRERDGEESLGKEPSSSGRVEVLPASRLKL